MSSTDQQRLERFRAGDHAALSELLTAYQSRLFNICLRMLGHREDAAEAAQEAMLKIVQHISGFRGRSQLSTWMIRIAMNEATTRLRQRKRQRAVSLEGGGNGRHDDQAAALRDALPDRREPSPASGVERDEQRRQLAQALAAVEEEFRAALVLRDIDGMDYQQIAEVLEVPVGTVKSRLFRGRLALRQQLQAMESAGAGGSVAGESAGASPGSSPGSSPGPSRGA